MIRHNCYNCENLKIVYDVASGMGGHVKLCKTKGKKLRTLKGGMFCKYFAPCDMTYPEKLYELHVELNNKDK